MTPFAAQASLDRRAAIAAMGGEDLGPLPVLWLIREALEAYNRMRVTPQMWVNANPVVLLKTATHTLLLTPRNASQILVELDGHGDETRWHEPPNAALVLHDAVKDDAVKAERLLMAIEAATQEGLR